MFHKPEWADEKDLPEAIKNQLLDKEGKRGLPKGWQPMTPEEFSQSWFFVYDYDYKEFRQANVSGKTGHWAENVRIFWRNNGEGIAMVQDYWAKKVLYFRCGCDHKWEEFGPKRIPEIAKRLGIPEKDVKYERGNCVHSTVCFKCGQFWIYDSSD